MSDLLPAVGGTQILDINPNAFPPGTMVDGTALTAANTTPSLTPVGASSTWKPGIFNGPRPAIKVAVGQGFSIPRPIQDDWTLYAAFRYFVPAANISPNWYSNSAFIDAEMPGVANDFGLTLNVENKFVTGVGNPDTSGTGTHPVGDWNTHIVAWRRNKTTGKIQVWVDGVLDIDITANLNSLTAPANLYFNISNAAGRTIGYWGRIVGFDAYHSDADRGTMEAAMAVMYAPAVELRVGKLVGYSVTGPIALKVRKLIAYTVVGAQILRVHKLIAYGVLGNPAGGGSGGGGSGGGGDLPTTETDLPCPPDEEHENPSGCCVPELNRINELRIGPLNSLEDIRKGIWLTQDRINVIIREWNKLADISQPNPPSV